MMASLVTSILRTLSWNYSKYEILKYFVFSAEYNGSDISNILCLPKYPGNCKCLLDAMQLLFNIIMQNGISVLIILSLGLND